jgi:rare lipoprotein A
MKLVSLCLLLLLLQACSSSTGRYQQQHDSTPVRLPTSAELHDPIPRIEAKSRGGNKDYQVLGKHYQVLDNAEYFTQTGTASWYGNKFHGHLTSNGEIYNMYSMSAAHKSLPLPIYVKVTNLTNEKSVIVRVNDRGPFHENRVIDLSYAAAYKLDMLKTGTAPVKIDAITKSYLAKHSNVATKIPLTTVENAKTSTSNAAPATQFIIQVFATKNELLAKNTATGLGLLYQLPVSWPEQNGIYRIQIGPLTDLDNTEQLLTNLQQNGYPQAYKKTI